MCSVLLHHASIPAKPGEIRRVSTSRSRTCMSPPRQDGVARGRPDPRSAKYPMASAGDGPPVEIKIRRKIGKIADFVRYSRIATQFTTLPGFVGSPQGHIDTGDKEWGDRDDLHTANQHACRTESRSIRPMRCESPLTASVRLPEREAVCSKTRPSSISRCRQQSPNYYCHG